jgi:hypothetical protein
MLRDIGFGTGVEAIRLINEAKMDSRKKQEFSSAFIHCLSQYKQSKTNKLKK